MFRIQRQGLLILLLVFFLIPTACQPVIQPGEVSVENTPASNIDPGSAQAGPGEPTLIPTEPFTPRPHYSPGELVDYTAQTGDTLEILAKRFNTSVAEILQANTFIPPSASTMPPGMPMKIPIYYKPLWGSPYRIIPDELFIDGPAQVEFDISGFVNSTSGWLKDYIGYAAGANRSGAEIVDYVALRYSVSPRLLLALLDFQAGALSQSELPVELQDYMLGYPVYDHKGLYLQLNWAANLLNNGYYGFRTGRLLEIELRDGRLERFDPWLNAATVALRNYFNWLYPADRYAQAIATGGFAQTYSQLFGDPWQDSQPHITGSLEQPEFILPFEVGLVWAYTGGPHCGWGVGEPYAALDFAPPAVASGCQETDEWAVAIADGQVVRSEEGVVVLDMDGDGDERTGWNIFYLHLATEGRAPLGADVKRGDRLGHPSCEGGTSTGTHVHVARKYNGEWLPAEGIGGVLAFDMEGWIPHNGSEPYEGTLTRAAQMVIACTCSNQASFIQSERP